MKYKVWKEANSKNLWTKKQNWLLSNISVTNSRQEKKGKYLEYGVLKIADYLLPDSEATLEEKFDILL